MIENGKSHLQWKIRRKCAYCRLNGVWKDNVYSKLIINFFGALEKINGFLKLN